MKTISTVKASLFTLILAFMVIGTIAIAEVMKKEQPTAKEEVSSKESTKGNATTMQWLNVTTHPSNPGDYIVTNIGNTDIDCSETSGELCAVELILPETDEIEDLLDRVSDGTNLPSLSEFLAEDASIESEVYKEEP